MAWDVETDGPFELELARRRDVVGEIERMVDGRVRFTTKGSVADLGAAVGVTTPRRAASMLDHVAATVR